MICRHFTDGLTRCGCGAIVHSLPPACDSQPYRFVRTRVRRSWVMMLRAVFLLGACVAAASGQTCDDGMQNGNEMGVDCGGNCVACPPTTTVTTPTTTTTTTTAQPDTTTPAPATTTCELDNVRLSRLLLGAVCLTLPSLPAVLSFESFLVNAAASVPWCALLYKRNHRHHVQPFFVEVVWAYEKIYIIRELP